MVWVNMPINTGQIIMVTKKRSEMEFLFFVGSEM